VIKMTSPHFPSHQAPIISVGRRPCHVDSETVTRLAESFQVPSPYSARLTLRPPNCGAAERAGRLMARSARRRDHSMLRAIMMMTRVAFSESRSDG
jgi:hypothetical protein